MIYLIFSWILGSFFTCYICIKDYLVTFGRLTIGDLIFCIILSSLSGPFLGFIICLGHIRFFKIIVWKIK